LVSALIVNFRAYGELTSCLHALKNNAESDLEVVVVDHATVADAATGLVEQFPRVHLIGIDANPGFGAGVNRAARVAHGKYFLLLNPDAVLHGSAAQQLAEWLDHHPNVGAVGPLVMNADGSVQASARWFPGFTTFFAGRASWLTRAWPQNPWSRRNLVAPEKSGAPIDVDWVSGACMMIRREAFEAVAGFDERFFLYWEDADFCFRLKRAGWSVVYHPGERVTHLTGRSSARAHRQSLVAFHRSAYRYFRKNGGRFAQVASPLVFVALYARLALKLASIEVRRASESKP
jgi:hypothetical protein